MSRAIEWTEEMDATLRDMRGDGCTCMEVAATLDVSKNAVINRCDRLGLVTGNRFRQQHMVTRQEDRDEEPLPPGHPVSWGAISMGQWPVHCA